MYLGLGEGRERTQQEMFESVFRELPKITKGSQFLKHLCYKTKKKKLLKFYLVNKICILYLYLLQSYKRIGFFHRQSTNFSKIEAVEMNKRYI